MGVIRKFLGPKSKYDKSLPYTYLAKVPIIPGDDELFNHYFADTICGLVEYLDEKNVLPEEVKLYGLFQRKEIELDKQLCLDADNKWLKVPHICAVLEDYYERTKDERFKGHIEKHDCAFDDRDTQGEGPFG